MFSRIRAEWAEFKKTEPGKRFQTVHDKQQETMPAWAGPLYIGGAIVSLGVGVVLVFIPGPAVLFFALAAGLLATQSKWVAAKLDAGEVWARKTWQRLRGHRGKHRATPAETPQARARRDTHPRQSASHGAAE